jgi:hypothetical protein
MANNQLAQRQRHAPWIGIGTSGYWSDPQECLHDAGLDFNVVAKDAKVEVPAQGWGYGLTKHIEVPGIQVNMKEGTEQILGVVSARYGIVQNQDAFELLRPFCEAGGFITNAGMTEQGLCFMVLHAEDKNILGDKYSFDVMCTNSFNGAFPCALVMVPRRIVCQNMYKGLMRNNDGLLHVRHGSYADERIKAAKTATQQILEYQTAFADIVCSAYSHELPAAKIEDVLLPMLFPYPKPGTPRELTSRERADQLRQEFMDVYYEAPDNMRYHGSAMGFLNAYFDYLSHRDPTKCMPGSWEDRRLSGLISGQDIKQKVIKEALK